MTDQRSTMELWGVSPKETEAYVAAQNAKTADIATHMERVRTYFNSVEDWKAKKRERFAEDQWREFRDAVFPANTLETPNK